MADNAKCGNQLHHTYDTYPSTTYPTLSSFFDALLFRNPFEKAGIGGNPIKKSDDPSQNPSSNIFYSDILDQSISTNHGDFGRIRTIVSPSTTHNNTDFIVAHTSTSRKRTSVGVVNLRFQAFVLARRDLRDFATTLTAVGKHSCYNSLLARSLCFLPIDVSEGYV